MIGYGSRVIWGSAISGGAVHFDSSVPGKHSGGSLSGQLDELLSVLTSATASANSAMVSVRVGADGAMQDLRIDDRALQTNGAILAAHILEVAGRAQAELRELLRAEDARIRADPRIAGVVAAMSDAVDEPRPPGRPAPRETECDDYVRPTSYLQSPVARYRS